MKLNILSEKLLALRGELEAVAAERLVLDSKEASLNKNIEAIETVLSIFPEISTEITTCDSEQVRVDSSKIENIGEASTKTITDWSFEIVNAKKGEWIPARTVGDIMLEEGYPNPSPTFHISVSTACSRLAEKGKLLSKTQDLKKFYRAL